MDYSSFLDLPPMNLVELINPRSLSFAIVAFAIISQLTKLIRNAYFHPLSYIPGSKLIASNNWTLFSAFFGRNHYLLPYAHKLYGEVVRLAPNVVSVADKDIIKEILVTLNFPKSPFYDGLELNDQPNVFTSIHKNINKRSRRMASAGFGLQHLRSLEPIMHECIRVLIDKIDQVLDDPASVKGNKILPRGQINICSFMRRLAADIFSETAFGYRFNLVKDESHEILDRINEALLRSWRQGFNPWMKWLVPWKPPLFRFASDLVRDRKEAGDEGRKADLLQFLIDSQGREGSIGQDKTKDADVDMVSENLTDRIIATEVFAQLIGGSVTVAAPLNFAMMYLVENPDKLTKLRDELDLATVNNSWGDIPTYDQIRNLPYLTGCLNETLRLRSSAAAGLPRVVTEDVTIKGWYFPEGTTIVSQIGQMHLSNKYFPEATKFIPERWIHEESPFPPIQEGSYYPFSAGARSCMGKNFALMELRLVVAALICNYDIEMVKGQRTDYVQYIVAIVASGSYIITMKKRIPKQYEL